MEIKLIIWQLKIYKELHLKLCFNLQECGLLEDLLEEDKMMKKIKKILILNGELFQKLNSQKVD